MAKKREKMALSIKDELEEKSKQLHGDRSIYGATLLTNISYTSSSRLTMFTNHIKQCLVPNEPESPKVCTGAENLVGKFSSSHLEAEDDLTIVSKIKRFEGSSSENFLYLLFVYNNKTRTYDVIEKKNVEDLTERYGYRYNNYMDNKEEGEIIPKGSQLYASTSYDTNGNYMYGKNLNTIYMIENYTIEDAIVISESCAKNFKSTEIDHIRISLNDNDILANLYGGKGEYKCFPDIGERIKNGVIACSKRIHNNQLLFDLKPQNLKRINFATDTPYYCNGKIEDIMIYSNKTLDEVPNNSFYKQIKKYMQMQEIYYTNIYNQCKSIVESGEKFTDDITYYYKKAKDYLDKSSKWVSDNNVAFNNMIIDIIVSYDSPVSEGSKLTGRYGNKGVISRIIPDDEMPYTKDGKRADVIVNALGVINRMNSYQLFELEMNFIGDHVSKKLPELKTIQEKEYLVFTVLELLNEDVEDTNRIKDHYNSLDMSGKEDFFSTIEKEGLYYRTEPLWQLQEEPLFERICKLYDLFPWMNPIDLYVNSFGREVKILRPAIMSQVYFMKLRQTSKKGYTARATGSISTLGVPEKSSKSKQYQDLNPRTPIRSGNQETINMTVGVSTETIAQLHRYYRSSVIGRRSLGEKLLNSTDELDSIEMEDTPINTNAQILNAYLKVLGIKINFNENREFNVTAYNDDIRDWEYNDKVFIGTEDEYEEFLDKERAITEIETGDIQVFIDDEYDKALSKMKEVMRHEREGTTIEINI